MGELWWGRYSEKLAWKNYDKKIMTTKPIKKSTTRIPSKNNKKIQEKLPPSPETKENPINSSEKNWEKLKCLETSGKLCLKIFS